MRACALFSLSVLAGGAWSGGAPADELKILSVGAMKPAFQQIIPDFINSSSHTVVVEYGSARAIRDRILRGEAVDVVFVTPHESEPLITAGKVFPPTVIASFGLGLGIPTGKPLPDIKDMKGLKQALLSANTVGVLNPQTNADGAFLRDAFQRHGFLQALAPKLKYYSSGIMLAEALMRGDIELGFAPTLDLGEVGVGIVDALPREIQRTEKVTAGVVNEANSEDAARTFIKFVRRTSSQEALKARGLDPVLSPNDWSAPQSAKAKNISSEGEESPIGNAAQPVATMHE